MLAKDVVKYGTMVLPELIQRQRQNSKVKIKGLPLSQYKEQGLCLNLQQPHLVI
jgi:hypothetical protein